MSDDNANIERVSFEEIQEFKNLDLFNLTWEGTGNRLVYLGYDANTKTFVQSYGTEADETATTDKGFVYFGEQVAIDAFLNSGGSAPSVLNYKNGDAILASDVAGTVNKYDLYEVVIDGPSDEFVFSGNLAGSVPTLQEVTDEGNVTTTNMTGAIVTGSQMVAPNLITNDADTFVSAPKITSNVTLTQTEYDGITPDANTIYYVTAEEVPDIAVYGFTSLAPTYTNNPGPFTFDPSGSYVYYADMEHGIFHQGNMSGNVWDVSAPNLSPSWDGFVYGNEILDYGNVIEGISFNGDGTKFMVIVRVDSATIRSVYYEVGDPYLLSTLYYNGEFYPSLNFANMSSGIKWNNTGTKLYILTNNVAIVEITVSTPYQMNTQIHIDGYNFTSEVGVGEAFALSDDGSSYYIVNDNDIVHKYNMAPYNLLSSSYAGISTVTNSFNHDIKDMWYRSSTNRLYTIGKTNSIISQYDL